MTILETDNEVVERKRSEKDEFHRGKKQEAKKSARRMPRLQEAKKDAASCEKLRGTASR